MRDSCNPSKKEVVVHPLLTSLEVVRYEMRMRPNWNTDTTEAQWHQWHSCSEQTYRHTLQYPVIEGKRIHDNWQYQVRRLFEDKSEQP